VDSYLPERAGRPETVRLWHKIRTVEDPKWTEAYHNPDPNKKSFGARVEVIFNDGRKIEDEITVANAHPAGARPFKREQYIEKFDTLTEGIITQAERDRFLGLVTRLPKLEAKEVAELNVQIPIEKLINSERDQRGIF
jgi:2-methylcitrate dehydratase